MSDIVSFDFEGVEMMAVTYKGRPAVIAKEFGKWLGYSKDGGKLVSLIGDEWKGYFQAGKHYVILTGKELADFKELLKTTPSYGFVLKGSHAMLLFKSGMYKVAFKSGKPEAEPLIDYVVDKVFPQLEADGRYLPDREVNEAGELVSRGEDSLARRDAELALREREAKIEIELRRIGLKERELSLREKREIRLRNTREGVALRNSAKVRFKMGRISREAYEAQFLTSWDIEAGVRAGGRDYDGRPENGGQLLSPLDIARKFGVSTQKIGRIVTGIERALGLENIRADEKYVSQRVHRIEFDDGTTGHPAGYLSRPRLTALIEEALVKERDEKEQQLGLFGKVKK